MGERTEAKIRIFERERNRQRKTEIEQQFDVMVKGTKLL